MRAEIICVGTELLLGKVNTNVSYLSERLVSIGLETELATTVKDVHVQITELLRQAFSRSPVVIITGGLGPTFDDITREAVAEVLGKKLVFHRETFQQIAAFFARQNMEMLKSHEKQAYLIESAVPIANEIGTAPGQIITLHEHQEFKVETIVLLPGPPLELQPMVVKMVLPFLKEKYETGIAKVECIHTVGLGESKVEETIKDVVEREYKLEGGDVRFSLLAQPGLVDVVISCSGKNELLIDNLITKTKNEIKEKLGNYVFGENDVSLPRAVGQLLGKKRMFISIAESCTGGLMEKMITDVAGSSLYYKGGIVAYSNVIKHTLLNVPKELIEKDGAVSSTVALAMANNVRLLFKTHIGIGVTGIAGPGGGTMEKPVGLVYIALAAEGQEKVFERRFSGNRQVIREKAAIFALDALRRMAIEK